MVNLVYLTQYDSSGKPTTIDSTVDTSTLKVESDVMFPVSSSSASQFHSPSWYTNNDIHITSDNTEVSITFIDEGAGYRNAFGYYIYDSEIKDKRGIDEYIVIFPNASKTGAGGSLSSGDTMRIPYSFDTQLINGKNYIINPNYVFPSGVRVGWWLSSNGWRGSDVNPSRSNIKYSNPRFNKESTLMNRYHTVSKQSPSNPDTLIIGFEDLNRDNQSTDHDFNDLIMCININPSIGSIDDENYISNNDVVTHKGTLCIEDSREDQGRASNFDFNDLVTRYNIKEETDSNGNIIKMDFKYVILNRGARFDGKLRLMIPYTNATVIREEYMESDESSRVTTVTNNSTASWITVFDSAKACLPPKNGEFATNTKDGWENNKSDYCYIRITVIWDPSVDVPRSSLALGYKYNYIYDVSIQNKKLYDIRTDVKYTCENKYLNDRGVTETYKLLYMPYEYKFRISRERRPLFHAYKGLLKHFIDQEDLTHEWWSSDREVTRLAPHIEPSEESWSSAFD